MHGTHASYFKKDEILLLCKSDIEFWEGRYDAHKSLGDRIYCVPSS